jgi:hypothetical protein
MNGEEIQMNIVLEKSQSPVTDVDIQRLEAEVGHHLPEDFKLFLKHHNGVWLDDIVFDIGEENQIGIQGFVLMNEILSVKKSFEIAPPMPMLPIASCECGDYIYLDASSDGKVYYWDHESWDDYTLISETFGAFLESLKRYDGPPIVLDPKDIISSWEHPDYKEFLDQYRIKKD